MRSQRDATGPMGERDGSPNNLRAAKRAHLRLRRAGRSDDLAGEGENFDVKQLLLRGRRLSHHAVIYVPTGLVVMALRNASGEAMVEMVCVPSPTP